nr:MAG TPA: hypothetical protein [Caudoviricetes sp.]
MFSAFDGVRDGSSRVLSGTPMKSAALHVSLMLQALPLMNMRDTACGLRPIYSARSLRYKPFNCMNMLRFSSITDCGSVVIFCAIVAVMRLILIEIG